jgi:glutamine---fructose-6-phosphate transaminase (isomerizing)
MPGSVPWSETRCRNCVLPTHFVGATFDEINRCSICASGQAQADEATQLTPWPEELTREGTLVVGLSGGRDSCFALADLHERFPGKLVAMTYDWPMVTESARLNASRMCAQLGIEHVIRAPQTTVQLAFRRRVVRAIGRKPDPRLVTLLMAPDKYFFAEAEAVRREYNASAIVFGAGIAHEYTGFKAALAGGVQNDPTTMMGMTRASKYRFTLQSGFAVAKNPWAWMIGPRIPLDAMRHTYFSRPHIVYYYQHRVWDGDEINRVLADFGWSSGRADREMAWRSGDGTADFYNYLYLYMLGYNERTVELSQSVRDGVKDRDDAIKEDLAQPHQLLAKIDWYAAKVGFQLDEFLSTFHAHLAKTQR